MNLKAAAFACVQRIADGEDPNDVKDPEARPRDCLQRVFDWAAWTSRLSVFSYPCQQAALSDGDKRPMVLSMLAVAIVEDLVLAPACAYIAISDAKQLTGSGGDATTALVLLALVLSACHWAVLLVSDPVYLYSDPFRPRAGFPGLVFLTRFCEVGSRGLLVTMVLLLGSGGDGGSNGWAMFFSVFGMLLAELCVLCGMVAQVDEDIGLGHMEQVVWWFVCWANPDYTSYRTPGLSNFGSALFPGFATVKLFEVLMVVVFWYRTDWETAEAVEEAGSYSAAAVYDLATLRHRTRLAVGVMAGLALLAYGVLGPLLALLQTRESLRRDGRREATRHSFMRQLRRQPPRGTPKELAAVLVAAGTTSAGGDEEVRRLAAGCSLKIRQWLLASHARKVCGGQWGLAVNRDTLYEEVLQDLMRRGEHDDLCDDRRRRFVCSRASSLCFA
jgi:hypothetical protein